MIYNHKDLRNFFFGNIPYLGLISVRGEGVLTEHIFVFEFRINYFFNTSKKHYLSEFFDSFDKIEFIITIPKS
jgi:hypothetical protein